MNLRTRVAMVVLLCVAGGNATCGAESGADSPHENDSARHWAYVSPVRPGLPVTDLNAPARHWSLVRFDAFVHERLSRQGLEPAVPAPRATFLRRAALDLRGLPPAISEVDEFVQDDRPDAHDRLLDRLLATPQFGERWARPWLDVARYADSHGFQRDDLRELWPYRDWVIAALNADLPFDQFVIEQIAGDLLPKRTVSQRVATGFHRCTTTNVEAGSDPEETRVNQVMDRVNTTGAVLLGSTLECAQCHDHKYDPFTMRDYYRLFAFFNQTAIEADRANPKVPGSIRFLGPRMTLDDRQATTLIMEEIDVPRKTTIMTRGDFRSPGEEVTPGVPAALHPLNIASPGRLDLAGWLVARENPLVARVTVNRWWAEIFGQGIVRTVEDFGTQGDPPSHPEVLDELAVLLRDENWSRKRVLRQIILSATYRQSSAGAPASWQRDPTNEWLGRGPRVRLDAELIRDNALAIAGLLSLKQFGAPVRPPQPDGLWVKIGGDKVDYVVSAGDDRYRRGVYVVWKRSAPYPSFANFDATPRMNCVLKRSRANTPLQALTLLNDPVYVEAADALAERVLREFATSDVTQQLAYAWRLCTARQPIADELRILRDVWEAYRADEVPGAEGQAWRAVAAVLLNLDETITKE